MTVFAGEAVPRRAGTLRAAVVLAGAAPAVFLAGVFAAGGLSPERLFAADPGADAFFAAAFFAGALFAGAFAAGVAALAFGSATAPAAPSLTRTGLPPQISSRW